MTLTRHLEANLTEGGFVAITMNEQAAVVVDGLSKSFVHNGVREQVLADVAFTLGQGEIVTLLGQSGCGKSTLLNAIGGFIRPDSGVVRVGGRDVERPGRESMMLFQDYGLLPWRTVAANVELGLEALQLPLGERNERIAQYLTLVGLRDKAGLFPS